MIGNRDLHVCCHVIVKGKHRAQGHGLMFGVCCHVSGVLVGKLLGGAHPVVHDKNHSQVVRNQCMLLRMMGTTGRQAGDVGRDVQQHCVTPWRCLPLHRHEVYDGKTDVWSFGVLLSELLTGQIPYQHTFMTPVQVRVRSQLSPPSAEVFCCQQPSNKFARPSCTADDGRACGATPTHCSPDRHRMLHMVF
jgi:serine/threonine protein kinase